jgi:MFS family permease
VLAHFSHHLISALITPLLPFIRDTFSFDYTRAGVLISALNLSYGTSQLPGGWLADTLGFRTLITIGISGVALCGFAFSFSNGFVMMVVILLLMGFLGGGYHPSASPLISSFVQPRYRGRALGIHQVGGTASYFLAPLLALSIPTLLFGISFFLLLSAWGYGAPDPKAGVGEGSSFTQTGGRMRSLIVVILLNVFLQIFVSSSISFIPFLVADNMKRSKEAAAVMLSLAHSAGIWAGPLGGLLSDRFGRVGLLLFTGLLAGPLILLLSHTSYGLGLSAVLILMGMTMYMSMPVTEAYVISHAPSKNRSTFLGIYYFASRGGPGLMAPAVGRMIDTRGFSFAFNMAGSLLTAIAVACATALVRVEQKEKKGGS